MQRARTPAAQKRPQRTPLRQLQLPSDADRTGLTPLFRRLRLKDHDRATPVSCARGPRSSSSTVPCTPGRPQRATLGAPSSTTLESHRASTQGLKTPNIKPGASEAPSIATLIPGALETSRTTIPEVPGSLIPMSAMAEHPENTVPAPLCSPLLGPSTPEPPSSTVPVSPCSSIPVASSESPGNTMCSLVLAPCTLESPGSTTPGLPNIISAVFCNSPGSSALPPYSSGSPGNASTASWTPGPPGSSSTPQKAPFHGWLAAPPDFYCSLMVSEPPSANGSVEPLQCQGTPEGAKSPAPVPLEQSPPGLPPIEASGLEPAESKATVTSPESTLGAVSWMLPLAWLEKTLSNSFLVECPRHSLSLRKPLQDASSSVTPVPTRVTGTSTTPVSTAVAGTSMTPVSMAVAGTSMTPVLTVHTGTSTTPVSMAVAGTSMIPLEVRETSMNTSRGSLPCAKDSAAETDSLLWHCPREQLKTLPRAELERRLETTLIIIKALVPQLRDWQESQRLRPGVEPAKQRDAFTQTNTTHPEGSSQSLLIRGLTGAAFRTLQDEQGALTQELSTLLTHALSLKASLSAAAQFFREFLDASFENLEKKRRALDEEREQMMALASQSHTVVERVSSKLQSCLKELAATRVQAEEALQAKEEVSCQLEKTLVNLQDTKAQLEQLTTAKSCLEKDMSSMMINVRSMEQERNVLQQEKEKLWEKTAELEKERNSVQQECRELRQELREATECREFLDQENQMCRTQLLEMEAKLNSTLATLQEHDLQHEKLMESHQCLREKQAALSKELDSTKAKLLSLQTKRNKVSWCSTDIMESKMRLQELADCLKAALEEQDDDDAPSRSKAWTPALRTPRHAGSSFVGSVLKAVAGRGANETTRSGSAAAKDKLASVLKQTEPEDTLLDSVKELRAVVSNLAMLSSRIQELEQSKFRALQTEISDLQLRLETVTAESQEKEETQAATIAKLNKLLRTKIEDEKMLQDVVKQQEEKVSQLLDKSGEVVRLKTEVWELKRLLQRAEAELKVLREEMKGKEHPAYVQERVLLRCEIEKLRLLLMEKENENIQFTNKHLEQVQGLERKLHQTQKMLRTQEERQEKIKEVLLAVPEVALGCQELQRLLCYLGLKPASKEAAEPL